MRKKLLSLLVLLMTAATGAWADSYLYLDDISGTTATLRNCDDPIGDHSGCPYFSSGSWYDNDYSGDFDDFKSNCTEITVDASGFDGDDLSYLFEGWTSLRTINNIGSFPTSNVTDMSNMFWGCSYLSSLDLSGWNTENVLNMAGMFEDCSSLTTLTFGSGWDTGNVTDMNYMFSGCSSLTTLDLSGWDTENVLDMSCMFLSCSSLSTLNLSGWDTSSVEYMYQMFFDCSELKTLNITGWDTSSVTDSEEMFGGCVKLNKSVTLKAGATGEYWATFYDVCNFQAPSGTQVFKVKLTGNEIEMTEITDGIVKSGQGVVLKNTSGSSITLTPTISASADDYTGNSLKGTMTEIKTTGANNYYVLNKKTAGVGFYKLSNTSGTIGANKAYLEYNGGAGAREFFLFDETTGIESVSVSDGENGEVYDLQGRRVSQPAKGLYIVRSAEGRLQGKNGKKVIINK